MERRVERQTRPACTRVLSRWARRAFYALLAVADARIDRSDLQWAILGAAHFTLRFRCAQLRANELCRGRHHARRGNLELVEVDGRLGLRSRDLEPGALLRCRRPSERVHQ